MILGNQKRTLGWLRKWNKKKLNRFKYRDVWKSVFVEYVWVSAQMRQSHSSLGPLGRIWSSSNQIKPKDIPQASYIQGSPGTEGLGWPCFLLFQFEPSSNFLFLALWFPEFIPVSHCSFEACVIQIPFGFKKLLKGLFFFFLESCFWIISCWPKLSPQLSW